VAVRPASTVTDVGVFGASVKVKSCTADTVTTSLAVSLVVLSSPPPDTETLFVMLVGAVAATLAVTAIGG